MAEIVAGAIAGAAFQILLKHLVSPTLVDIKRRFRVTEAVDKLQEETRVINGILLQAEDRPVEGPYKDLLEDLDVAANQAVAILCELEVSGCCLKVNLCISKSKYARDIEKVLQRFKELTRRAKTILTFKQLANSYITAPAVGQVAPVEPNGTEIVEVPDAAPSKGTVSVTLNYSMSKRELKIPDLERLRLSDHINTTVNLVREKNPITLVLGWSESRVGQNNYQEVLEGLKPHSDLESLKIIRYKGKNLPRWNMLHDNLISIKLEECSRCKDIPFLGSFPNLENLSIVSCTSLLTLTGLDTLENLKRMKIIRCEELESISYAVRGQLVGLKSLRGLKIADCKRLTCLPCELLESCSSSLEYLSIYKLGRLENFEELGSCISKMPNLKKLRLFELPLLKGFTIDFSCIRRLKKLAIGVFPETSDVESLNNDLSSISEKHCASLKHLELVAGKKWDSLPDQIVHLRGLKILELREFEFEVLPDWLGELSWVKEIWIISCEKLSSLPSMKAMQRLTNLRKVDLINCSMIKSDDSERLKVSHIESVKFGSTELSYGKDLAQQ